MQLTNTWNVVITTLRRKLGWAHEPQVLFPLIAVALLTVIWSATFNLIQVERADAKHAAAKSSSELAETYEAQVVRALREIDQTLRFIKYDYELEKGRSVLSDLKKKNLLLPDLLFVIAIADRNGDIVASTRPFEAKNVVGRDYFEAQRRNDVFAVGKPRRGADEQWKLQFSRRLNAAGGSFAGVVIVMVDAAYFVSGYEPSKLGDRGVLGVLGTDGVFRARRSGETVSAGDAVDYAAMVPDTGQADTAAATVSVSSWDGVRRYTSARQLFDFPLAVVVGLSEEEQLASVDQHARVYLWRAVAGSVVVIVVIVMLGRMSWELAQIRRREVEAQMAHAERVEYLAYHDGLTGLPNRSLFSKLLEQGINQARRHDRRLAVIFLDLDRFKQINDTLGHDAGDALLQETAKRLTTCLRDSDTVARLGGDEFVALLPELEKEEYAATVARKILSATAKPFTLAGHELRITASVGIGIYPKDGEDEQTLTKNADVAMYQAKSEGKNNFQFYSKEMNKNSLQRLALESDLRRALERGEFRLHYQAKRDLRSGRITGMEALLRWQHPDLGTVQPMQFIPLAEETGLIVPIGEWVLRTACLQNIAWQKQGLPPYIMAVNLSARQFGDDHLLDDVAAILRDTGMDPHLLELEITESMIMRNVEKTIQTLTRLKEMSIRIAIDDFGTGYSSLATLKQFPLDTIKIDGSFIRDVSTNAEDRGLTEAIIAVGRTLGLTVIAEGVETREQADFLRQYACDEFQGFYFNKPLPAEQFAELLRTQAAASSADGERKPGQGAKMSG
ncbi:MAG TPA: EAL domain-containing protein [Burkholderiales bacterium]|nr:EAL domain-containing protein [Burkholderiales bacterium]